MPPPDPPARPDEGLAPTPGGEPAAEAAAGDTAGGPSGADEPGPLIEIDALLGRGTHYQGKLYFDGHVRIEGRFEGPIAGTGVLVVADGAEVDGDIAVGTCIVVGGSVRGQVRAREAIELHAPATVHGDLHAPNIFIDRGATFEGSCRMAPLTADEDRGASAPAAAPAPDDADDAEPDTP